MFKFDFNKISLATGFIGIGFAIGIISASVLFYNQGKKAQEEAREEREKILQIQEEILED